MTTKDAIRAGIYTAIFGFIGVFAPGLLGWLSDIGKWADSDGVQPFPAFSGLGYLAVSALAGAIGGLVNTGYRMLQVKGVIGGKAPTYQTPPQ